MAEGAFKFKPTIAIEIGNVNSGYVCFNHRILTATYGNCLPEDRIPTALLLNSDLSVNSFGTLAKDRYFKLTLKQEEADYVYFENCFQPSIKTSNLQQSTGGKHLPITKEDIYGIFIEHLYDKCLKNLYKINNEIFKEEDVLVIFLVDDENETNIMKSAVDKTRIKKENVRFVLEMDAAALYCRDQNVYFNHDANNLDDERKCKFAVLDLGGKKTQYCKYEVLGKDKYRRKSEAVLTSFGGETVTELFLKELESIVGKENWETFTTKNKSAYLNIRRSFEKHKLGFQTSKSDIIMELPKAFIALVDGPTCDGISFEEDNKIVVQRKILEGLFGQSLREIIEQLKSDINDIDIIVLVAGFSQSPYTREYITTNVQSIPIVLVPTPDLAVLKGAVMMGHKQLYMSEYAYGFLEESTDVLSESMKTGEHSDKVVFRKVIDINEMVGPGKFTINVRGTKQTEVLYKTKEPDVMFYNEETRKFFKQVDSKAPTEKCQGKLTMWFRVDVYQNVPNITLEVKEKSKGKLEYFKSFLPCKMRNAFTSK